MDQVLTLHYRGKDYTITVVDSTERYPHFYWCLIRDAALIEELDDDCVAFKCREDGVLYPADFYAERAHALLDRLKALVSEHYLLPLATPKATSCDDQ